MYYQIKFHSDWHCGSGLASGADVDALVVKDSNGLPYIPGKTIKGLIREAFDELEKYGKNINVSNSIFGTEGNEKGCLFFTNAEISEQERDYIVKNKLQRFLYRTQSSTAIDDNGIAKKHSLRKIETVVPCTLEGEIKGVADDKELKDGLKNAMKYIKRLGQNRNRGLGRCSIIFKED